MNKKIKKVIIAGGGTAGWLAAAALSKKLGDILSITLVESDMIDTVGVGEATIPPMRTFHKLLGIDEQEFMRRTSATFKLGISFENWGRQGSSYIHSFGKTGAGAWLAEFHNFWLRGKEQNIAKDFDEYCFELQAAKQSRFGFSQESSINYAYHLDAGRYGKYLREFSEKLGVERMEGTITGANLSPSTGFIESLQLQSGALVEGDLFIDCTGFRALLMEKALHVGYEDWSHWLPCDSAIAVQTKAINPAVPYTRSIAHDSGWQWQIPLQHRVGNGLVYCSNYLEDESARTLLLKNIEGDPINEPRVIKYRTGRRRLGWSKNCLALGLSSGFLEPLESTSIHLFMTGITRLMQLFPFDGVDQTTVDEYNSRLKIEMEQIRDFIILHYHVTDRTDSPFWRHCRSMTVPDTLTHRLNLFERTGHSFQAENELFRIDSWTQVMMGQGLMPKHYHQLAATMTDSELGRFLDGIKASVDGQVEKLPSHQDFVNQYCRVDS
ncbi:tryptophan halogenase family protein [Teredinibacter franksiae]|uniref:tryptophan halogenase family protein n=1 Tax=Teredinibacter franksiae TaxID=2761453 RepID=UPI0016294074|nr:tryptophan halogenase family protein [Teredinibacter franksiae]